MADLFRKGKSLYSSTTNSFGTGTGETITPSSVAGLPTSTELVLTFDRTVTGKLERIRGHISGGNFVIDERGVDNTSDTSHTSPTVEYIPNAEDMNDLVDGILVNHTQAGLHDFNGTEVILDADADTTITADTDDQIDIKIAGTDRFTLTATALKLGGDQEITDSSGNELLTFSKTASAVNEITLANAATGNGPTISATGGDTDIDINITPKGTGRIKSATVAVPTISSTDTLTNKRITKRVVTTTDDATAVIDTDVTDEYQLSAVANATEFTLTGTPTDGQVLIIKYKDAGVSKALTWTGFTAIGTTLPTATTAGKWGYVGCKYNSAASQWHVLAVQTQA